MFTSYLSKNVSKIECVKLIPGFGVSIFNGQSDIYISKAEEPWLEIDIDFSGLAGKWIKIVYDSSLMDELVRPQLRFELEKGSTDILLPAPLLGRACWICRVPHGTLHAWISPLSGHGYFGFRVVELKSISLLQRVWRSAQYKPFITLKAMTALVGRNPELADIRFQTALGSVPIKKYASWIKNKSREPEWDNFDRPRTAYRPQIRSIRVVSPQVGQWNKGQNRGRTSCCSDSGYHAQEKDSVIDLVKDLKEDDFAAFLSPEAHLAPGIELILGEALAKSLPDIVYTDEINPNGCIPRLKPDWSPIMARQLNLFGEAWFARVGWIRKNLSEHTLESLRTIGGTIGVSSDCQVLHLRRPLVACIATNDNVMPIKFANLVRDPCTVIIPIRDKHELLRECIDSLEQNAAGTPYELIIVDNGSVEPQTSIYLNTLSGRSNVQILYLAGDFNFSALCNAAARFARTELLIFLNSDTRVLVSDWMAMLSTWARMPDLGAIGAKLIYPNGKIQHAGIGIGMHRVAGHLESGQPQNGSGYFGRLDIPHELSAVTGACLAVEKTKFEAVGGFDEENFPVELGDVDLCLRLAARGWRCIIEPRVSMVHYESATRGKTKMRLYRREIDNFRKRWMMTMRNDPYYHPALSIDSHSVELG